MHQLTMPLSLFQAFGVELEYMIVDARSLSVRPIADRVLEAAAGEIVSEVECGEIAWSNELALHVIELKTNGPAPSLAPLPGLFQEQVRRINHILKAHGARLMPSAMHPWMDPHRELRLWPHDYNPVYEAYNRIFDCRGHGWANLQSVHLNLPFAGDEEFGRLHAAIRLLLPILPALAASSPVAERAITGWQDTRMEVYRGNSARIPSITGQVAPEPVFTRGDYERLIFQRMYADIAPHDPEKILQHEWLNSRGAIARFDRGAIEIRVLDVQECPAADVAICAAVAAVLKALTDQRWTSVAEQQSLAVDPLAAIFLATIRDAEQAPIDDRRYLAQFGYPHAAATAGELWRHILDRVMSPSEPWSTPLETILRGGPLSRRIVKALGNAELDSSRLEEVYRELCDCLAEGRMFAGKR
jgi:gamma-glutamyl:cysteine ligase YbdK (ATP-grasp superfamily)